MTTEEIAAAIGQTVSDTRVYMGQLFFLGLIDTDDRDEKLRCIEAWIASKNSPQQAEPKRGEK